MSGLKSLQVTLWEHSQFQATVRAHSLQDAIQRAQQLHAAAPLPQLRGFELLDSYGGGWDARPLPPRGRKGERP
jgi:hypothetical protein